MKPNLMLLLKTKKQNKTEQIIIFIMFGMFN